MLDVSVVEIIRQYALDSTVLSKWGDVNPPPHVNSTADRSDKALVSLKKLLTC